MARAYLLLQWATLSLPDGMPDLSQLRHAVKTIGKPLDRYATVSLGEIKSRVRTGLIFGVCPLRCQDFPDVYGVSYIQLGGGVSW